MIRRNVDGYFEDEYTGLIADSKTQLYADLKRMRLKIPYHPFLSNRYVLNKIRG